MHLVAVVQEERREHWATPRCLRKVKKEQAGSAAQDSWQLAADWSSVVARVAEARGRQKVSGNQHAELSTVYRLNA